MTTTSYYRAGVITIAAGATTAFGLGTAWSNNVKAGDLLLGWDGVSFGMAHLASDPADDQNLVIANPWRGPALVAVTTYLIGHGQNWRQVITLNAAVIAYIAAQDEVLAQLEQAGLSVALAAQVFG